MASVVISTVTATITAKATTSTTPASRAASQDGIIGGANPSKYDPKNPIIIFIIQVESSTPDHARPYSRDSQTGIIIIFTRLLHFPLSRMRQPRVIAEIIGGILLGPSVFGLVASIPHVSNANFDTSPVAYLDLRTPFSPRPPCRRSHLPPMSV